jgi:segregation and condensation protein A
MLAFRLAKLDAMRQAVEALRVAAQLGRDVFVRGDPEAVKIVSAGRIEGDLYQLMSAYIGQRKREDERHYRPQVPTAYALDDARARLRELLPELAHWTSLSGVAPTALVEAGPSQASYLASTLSASLELVKEGALEARQMEAFAEVYLRSRPVQKTTA